MSEPTETKTYNGHEVRISRDSDPVNPRKEFDNMGVMVCAHRRYNLGDEPIPKDVSELATGWDEVELWLRSKFPGAEILPLFLYDHSGITIRTRSFEDHWDSGQVGFIYCTAEKIRSEMSVKRISDKTREKVREILRGEVKLYDDYLRGEVYGYQVVSPDGQELDSCWGFYGSDHDKSGLMENAKAAIESNMQKLYQERMALQGVAE